MTLDQILTQAQLASTGKAEYLYNYFKRKIEALNLPAEKYEEAIKKLCDIIEY